MTRPVSILTSEGEEVRSERDSCRVRRREVMDSGGHDPRGAPVAHPGGRKQAGIYQLPGANHQIFFTPSTRRHPPLKTRGSRDDLSALRYSRSPTANTVPLQWVSCSTAWQVRKVTSSAAALHAPHQLGVGVASGAVCCRVGSPGRAAGWPRSS